ncbi:MAG: hypothetical protein LUD79_04625 [Oscillospiraceae bacterium]|nr:hypothetical protein [Oscillospiraceae bacterium]
MRKNQRGAMGLRYIAGEVLTGICAVHAIANLMGNLAMGSGIALLANLIAAVGCVGLFVTVIMYYDTEDMTQWPAVFMCAFLAQNIVRIFSTSWAYVFMLLPLAAMVLLILQNWNLFGIAAGGLTFVLNLVVGMIYAYTQPALLAARYLLPGFISGKLNSMYLLSLLLNNNSLMGIACICFFCILRTHGGSGGRFTPSDTPQNPGGFPNGNGGGYSSTPGSGGGFV